MTIPIRNLYFLLLYAHDALDEAGVVDTGSLPQTNVADLFAHVLDTGVNHLLRRGLDRGYLPHREAIPGVRGRIDLAGTVKGAERLRGRLVCEYDELTPDTPHNRILRATARALHDAAGLHPDLRDRLGVQVRRLGGVSDVPLSRRLFRGVQLHRGQRFYRFLLAVCRIVCDHLIPDQETGGTHFREFEPDVPRMRRLFERFVRNFLRREQKQFRLCGRQLKWTNGRDAVFLPTMQTDITLRRRRQRMVIETKFTANQLTRRFGRTTVRSDHIYQLFAYLRNVAVRSPDGCQVGGILLYPRVGPGPDFRCELHGHPVRVTTLDLGREWEDIRRQLLALLDPAR